MQNAQKITTREKWALFRFSVIARLIAFPPEKGELKEEIIRLSETQWNHPVSGKSVKIAFSTIESWYYRALEADKNPFKTLERKTRSDVGNRRTTNDNLRAAIIELHKDNPNWSHKLHYDNLTVLVRKDLSLGEMPSYSTIRRFRQQMGFEKIPQKKYSAWKKSSVDSTVWRKHEIRRFENPFVNGLWHCARNHSTPILISEWETGGFQKKGNIKVGFFSRPQSTMSDFYRELGDIFGLPVSACNRWCNFMTLRKNWIEHISTTLYRPVRSCCK